METLRLKPRQPVEDVVESWDDDDFMIDGDDITCRSSSTTAHNAGSRRNSHSSFRSDFESVHAEEEQQVLLPAADDEESTSDAIALAASAGIPLPKNVPPSALMGGTIKRLGGKKIKKIFQEDWTDDLELPDDPQPLRVKPQDSSKFPDALQQVGAGSIPTSPVKVTAAVPMAGLLHQERAAARRQSDGPAGAVDLDLFRDTDDEDDFLGDGAATIKMPKTRQVPQPISLITPPTPQKSNGIDDDFEQDLELPSDGKLTLSKRKDIPKTPSLNMLEEFEWGEGSLGTRFGGTRRDGRSGRSSSVSALSPSVSSSITAESEGEDDTFDGLVLPAGPVNFEERLQTRRSSRSPQRAAQSEEPQPAQPKEQWQPPSQAPQKQQQQQPQVAALGPALGIYSKNHQQQQSLPEEDLLEGFDLGDGDVFDSNRLTYHRNVRIKNARSSSPSRPKAAVSITFKPTPASSRLPRPMSGHERTHTASSLEPVSECGGPVYNVSRRSQSRLGHSAQSSLSSIPTPSTPSASQAMPPPSTPRRREAGPKTAAAALRNELTTTNAQLLRLKRSLPAMRQPPSPAPRPVTRGYDRPPSRSEMGNRAQLAARPKTPVEKTRVGLESAAAQARKNPLPFLPAGASQSQSHHVTAKNPRGFRRHDSETSVDFRPGSRAVSRSTMRSPSPARRHRYAADKTTQEGSWQQLSKPRRLRQFGDGHELDGFDDLPTSAQVEESYLRPPASSSKTQLRSKLYQNILPDRTITASSMALYSSARLDNLPHFARDTAASRIARETSLAQRTPSGPLAPLTAQRVAQLSTRSNYGAPHMPRETVRSKKSTRRPPQLKPHLISNLGGGKESKTVNGMYYNPANMRWEGNENALSDFDPPASSPSTASIPPYLLRERENSTPRPALITPIGATKGVQVVGGMVFDPQNMCWLKLGPQNPRPEAEDVMDGFNGIDSDEDVFKDIPDLDDMADTTEGGGGRTSDIKDDWLVGEEFDVGPEFVRRQREEEQRWRKKCERWVTLETRDQSTWRWLLRDMVTNPI